MGESTQQEERTKQGASLAAGGSFVSAFVGLVGASCCILPIILFNMGIGSAVIGGLQFFADKKGYFLTGALLLLALGIIASIRKGERPPRHVIVTFILSTVIILIAFILPSFEDDILRLTGHRG